MLNVAKSQLAFQWDLVCKQSWLVAVSQSAFMAGQFVTVTFGFLADVY